ncbi:recombinase family protein [Paenibacillus sp. WQ 127069]|uniref:Recombinase family protein n=1 Tax=Paenibacillus baimaensis TaxID=2982185 RepID=A0ABT2UU12_9BACL|nr:recombinase family protein [Paenibacillus sp. WQ 127069]MCU6798037.1 recombinase family protein [Paenibacillus sp. WQ 127069]
MKAVVYTRVSTASQAEEGFSLQAQYENLIQYVRLQSWDLLRIYTDPGVSAKDLNRPGVKEMLEDLKSGKFDAIVVHKLDRLTRNISDLYDLVELVNKKNIKLVSTSENIDTSTPMGRMFVYLLGIFAQMFRENLSEEVKKGLTERAEQGFRNAFAPYGYEMNEKGELDIVPDQAEFIREVFQLLIEKKNGYHTIAKILNKKNVPGLRGGIFHGSTIEQILKNHTYTGKNHWKLKDKPESERIIRDASHDAIIDQETFDKAQDIIGRRSRGELSRSSYDYPFSTIIRCDRCGGPYHGLMMPKIGNKYYYYRCFNKLRGKCDQSDLSELKFERMFFAHFSIGDLGIDYKEVAVTKDDPVAERKKIERDLDRSEQRRKNWQYAFGDGKLPYDDYVKLIDEEMVRVQELQVQLEGIREVPQAVLSRVELWESVKQLQENWGYLERETKKDFISALFKSITILKVDKVWSITGVDWV